MKRAALFTLVTISLFAFVIPGAAQNCDPNTQGFIRCGYYGEGFQDGANDARSFRNADYRRYSEKYERKYENDYRSGYDAGYESVRPSGGRWSFIQRSAYDIGYTTGQNDRRTSSTYSGQPSGGYEATIGAYFRQGYDDGFAGRARTYDVPLGGVNPGPFPPGPFPGNNRGMAQWAGKVDDRVNIVIQGSIIRTVTVSGRDGQVQYANVQGTLPRRAVTVNATRSDGRGEVNVIQQPDRNNDYTAIIQVYDRNSGADNYRVDISWEGRGNVEEPYQSGSVNWRGRVDQTANITINGSDVQTQNVSGSGVSNTRFTINGYLANRPGTVTARKRNGRGTVTVVQQPSFANNFTAVIQVFDPQSGADNYEVDISW